MRFPTHMRARSPLALRNHQKQCIAGTHDAVLHGVAQPSGPLQQWNPPPLHNRSTPTRHAARFALNHNQPAQQVVLTIDSNSCITRVDADAHPIVGPLASQRGEVMALALWLLAEKAVPDSKAAELVNAVLPDDAASRLLTPLLWDESTVRELLRGSPVVDESLQRRAAIDAEWAALQETAPGLLPPGVFFMVVFG